MQSFPITEAIHMSTKGAGFLLLPVALYSPYEELRPDKGPQAAQVAKQKRVFPS